MVFEVLSPGNSEQEMAGKLAFYDRWGVEEYYVYDPPPITRLEIWLRQHGRLQRMAHLRGWTSPRLGIRFALGDERLALFDPTGRPFLSTVELDARLRAETQRADAERERADAAATLAEAERARADAQQARAEAARDRAERLAARLRALGIKP